MASHSVQVDTLQVCARPDSIDRLATDFCKRSCKAAHVTELVTEAALEPAALVVFCASTSSRGRAPPKGLARGARGLGACSPSAGSAAAFGSSCGGGASTCEPCDLCVMDVAALIGPVRWKLQ